MLLFSKSSLTPSTPPPTPPPPLSAALDSPFSHLQTPRYSLSTCPLMPSPMFTLSDSMSFLAVSHFPSFATYLIPQILTSKLSYLAMSSSSPPLVAAAAASSPLTEFAPFMASTEFSSPPMKISSTSLILSLLLRRFSLLILRLSLAAVASIQSLLQHLELFRCRF